MIGIIGGKAFGTIEKSVDPRVGQHGQAVHCSLKDRFKMVEILWQLVKFKSRRDAVQCPGLGIGFKRAQQYLACVFFVIRAFIGHPQHRQLRQAGNGFGHDVEMFAGLKGHVHAQHLAHLAAPHAATVYHHVACNVPGLVALFPRHAGDAPVLLRHAGGAGPFKHQRALLPRPFGQRQRDVGRVALPVLAQIHRPGDVRDVQVGVFVQHLLGADLFYINAKGAGHGGLAVNLFAAFIGQGHRD